MRRQFIILTIATIFLGCAKQKEQLEKFTFDNSQIAFRKVHQYSFDRNGRIKIDRNTTYHYIAGMAFDSTVTVTFFKNNGKGQLILVVDNPDASRQVKIYNDVDSIIGDYRINEFGDTTNLAVTVYNGNKVLRRITRHLSAKLKENVENIKKSDLRNYDTMLFVTELIYDKDVLVKTLSQDKIEMVSEENELYYENGKRTKTVTYALLGDSKYIKKTTYYENTADKEPDFISIGTQGDTIEIQKTVKKSDGRIVLKYNKQFGMQDIWHYNKVGQLIATEAVDINAHEKTISTFTYDTRGNSIEELTYRERLNNER